MADTEGVPVPKRRKVDVTEHNGQGNSLPESDNEPKSSVSLHIRPNAIARLRQIAKSSNILSGSSQKQTDKTKDNSKFTVASDELPDNDQNDSETGDKKSKENNTSSSGVNGDIIMSSAGSSPAHSPKPEDLVVLSTPPKKTLKEMITNQIGDNQIMANKNLTGLLDQSEKQSKTNETQSKEKVAEPVVAVENEAPKPTETTPERKPEDRADGNPPLSIDTGELKKVLRAMIDEKFKQVEEIYQNQEPENELRKRVARLEEENKGLQEYAAKLEKAVKLLLSNQRNKKEKQNQTSQTDDVVSTTASTTKSSAATSTSLPTLEKADPTRPAPTPKGASPTVPPTTQAPQQTNQVSKPENATIVTSRLTSTQAAIPGHSAKPATLPQRATHVQQHVRVTTPVMQLPQGQRPSHPSNVATLRPNAPLVTSPTRRPAPVTVTVHPQSTTTTMLFSPSYPTQLQKNTFATNTVAAQPTQQFPTQRAHRPILLQQTASVQSMITSPQAKVVFQRAPNQQAAQAVPQYPNTATMRSPTQIVGHQPMNAVNPPQPRPLQGAVQQARPQVPMAISPRATNLEQSNNYQVKDLPGRPTVSIAVVSNGIVLSWNMQNTQSSCRIVRYQLFALQDVGSNTAQWKKIGVVNALPLPMACTLTQFMPGNKYHFTVRAQDEHGRCGPLSEPCTVTLT